MTRSGKADMHRNLEPKLDTLEERGVTSVDRRQTYLDEAIDVGRIHRGAVLFPGTRLIGADICRPWSERR